MLKKRTQGCEESCPQWQLFPPTIVSTKLQVKTIEQLFACYRGSRGDRVRHGGVKIEAVLPRFHSVRLNLLGLAISYDDRGLSIRENPTFPKNPCSWCSKGRRIDGGLRGLWE